MSSEAFRPFSDHGQVRARELERMARQLERDRQYVPGGAFLDSSAGTVLVPPVAAGGTSTYGLDSAVIAAGSPGLMHVVQNAVNTFDWTLSAAGITNLPAGSDVDILGTSGTLLLLKEGGVYLIGGQVFWEGTMTFGTDTLSATLAVGSLGTSIACDMLAASDKVFSGFSPNACFQALHPMVFGATFNSSVVLSLSTTAANVSAVPQLYFVRLR